MKENVTIDQWYKCKIDKKLYRELIKRSDWQGIKHVSIWILCLIVSGFLLLLLGYLGGQFQLYLFMEIFSRHVIQFGMNVDTVRHLKHVG